MRKDVQAYESSSTSAEINFLNNSTRMGYIAVLLLFGVKQTQAGLKCKDNIFFFTFWVKRIYCNVFLIRCQF